LRLIHCCCCFVAGTIIQTIDGEKAIEDIKIGDWVLSDDPNTPGDIEYKQVLQTFNHDTTNLVDIFINGEKITTTDSHPFWVEDVGWVAARDLNAGSHLQTKNESWLSIDKVETHTGLTTVYNFEVAGFHTYFVSDVGLLVHNSCPIEFDKQGKHIPEHRNFMPGKSELTHPNPQELLDKFGGTGQQVGKTPIGQAGSKERIDFGETIGNHSASASPTTNGIIHYSNNGAHIVPSAPSI
jgi:Pretoxin HINT domain/Bacterial toxin 50